MSDASTWRIEVDGIGSARSGLAFIRPLFSLRREPSAEWCDCPQAASWPEPRPVHALDGPAFRREGVA